MLPGREKWNEYVRGNAYNAKSNKGKNIIEAKSLPYKTTIVRGNFLYIFHTRKHLKARSHCGRITSEPREIQRITEAREFRYSFSFIHFPILYLAVLCEYARVLK